MAVHACARDATETPNVVTEMGSITSRPITVEINTHMFTLAVTPLTRIIVLIVRRAKNEAALLLLPATILDKWKITIFPSCILQMDYQLA